MVMMISLGWTKLIERLVVIAVLALAIIYSFSIDTRGWLDSKLCVPNGEFRTLVILAGVFIAVTYFIFAYHAAIKLRRELSKVTTDCYPLILGIVFGLCSLCHFVHVMSIADADYKLLILPIYTLLIYFHIKLIWESKKAISNLSETKTIKEYTQISDKNKALESELLVWTNRQASLTSLKFRNGDASDVKIDEILSYEVGKTYEIGEGVTIVITYKDTDKYILICDLVGYEDADGIYTAADVKPHYHSDMNEVFEVIEGSYYDRELKITVSAGQRYEYQKNILHHPEASGAKIKITGYRS